MAEAQIYSNWHAKRKNCRKKWMRQTLKLEQKEYSATVGGNAVTAVVTGKMEVKSLDIKPEVVDPEDIDMLSELVIAAVNEAIRAASTEKAETMERLSGGLNMPGMF